MRPALGLLVATLAVAALVGCGGGGGGGDDSCTDLFTTPLVYTGTEYIDGTCLQKPDYPVTVTVAQAEGTCEVSFVFTSNCSGTLSGHELPFTCTNGYSGTVTFEDDLSTFAGYFTWTTAGGCTGTTTFNDDIVLAE